jgi:uncharacterized membrane protein YfcA
VALSFIAGGFLGSKLALTLSDAKMKKIFAIIMMLIAIKMLFFDKSNPINNSEATKIQQSKTQ